MNQKIEESSPNFGQNVCTLAQPPRETSRDSANNQAAQSPETEKEAAVASSALFGLGAALASLHRLWLNWDDVSAINGVNPYGTDGIDCEIEAIFKSGQTVKVKLGEMIGIKTLSECPLGLGSNICPKHGSPEEVEWTRNQVKEWKRRFATNRPDLYKSIYGLE